MSSLDRAAVDLRLASLEARVRDLLRDWQAFEDTFRTAAERLADLAEDPAYVRERTSAIAARVGAR